MGIDSVQRVTILPQEAVGTVNPYLHGHFAEHLGELIYPGISVPPDSTIPNTGGIRNDVVEALKPLGIPVLRWPGGCFADDYHWRDGVGPVGQRPKRINVHWGMAEEPNRFGTHEFVAFCRAIGAEPYFAANLGSGTPNEMRDWIEYCNFGGSSTLADERRANGADEPFRIRYWGIGNENWGCGGHMSPEAYAERYCQYRTFAFSYPDAPLEGIACGPNGPDWSWSRRFLETARKAGAWDRLPRVQGFAAHYYCGTTGKSATEYDEAQFLELLAKAYAIDGVIAGHRSIMDEYDPQRKIKLLMDEWGAWHPVETGKPRGGLYQQNTIRDACVAGLSLDVFHNHADKLFMANIAQLINVLQALLLVDENGRCVRTPTYHVFHLYKAHQNGTAVRFVSAAESVSDGGNSAEHCRKCYLDHRAFSLRAVNGSATIHEGGRAVVTLVNAHPTESVEVDLDVHPGRLTGVAAVTLANADIRAHNTFDNPDVVTPGAPYSVPDPTGGDRTTRVTLPPASVTRLTGRLA